MKELGKGKKIWTGMFLSYMLIILLCFFLYSGMIAFETYTLGRERTERENQVQVQELGNLIESRLIAAKSVASRINSSSAVRRLYMSVIDDGQVLNSYTLYSVLNDMRQVQASVNRLDMSEAAVFIDGYNHGYSYTGVL